MWHQPLLFLSSAFLLRQASFAGDASLSPMTRQKKAGRGFAKSSRSPYASASPSSGRRKFYAVRGGRDGFSGVLSSWDECKVQVTGVSGVAFKSFRTYDEALAFAQNRPQDAPFTERKKKFYAVRYNGFQEVFASWEECSMYVKGVPNAQYKGFQNYEEARRFAAGETEESGCGQTLNTADGAAATRTMDGMPEVAGVVLDVNNAGAETWLPDIEVLNPDSKDKPEQTEHLVVFTDGACTNNGRSNSMAGYGAFFGEGSPFNISKPLPGRPTNQRAEMMAVLQTIRTVLRNDLVLQGGRLEIRTDSQVCSAPGSCRVFTLFFCSVLAVT